MKTDFLSLIGVELNPVSSREKFISALGGLISIAFLIWSTQQVLDLHGAMCLITSMAASAVLLFAIPHGQLSQPWPLVGGNVISALIGVTICQLIPVPWLAGGVAVGLAILGMHQLKCLHPPGAATALTAVAGGDSVHALGYEFVVFPVLTNCLIMLGVAIAFNWPFPWRRYPAALLRATRQEKPHPAGAETQHEDIVKALRNLDSFIDVTEDDIIHLSRMIAREREARLLRAARKVTRAAPPSPVASEAPQNEAVNSGPK